MQSSAPTENLATADPLLRPRGRAIDRRWALVLLGAGLVASLVLGALSDGFHHMDDLAHVQIARWAWRYPRYLLDDWGRPGFTALYFLPAGLGIEAARALSAVLTAATAWLAYRSAARLGLRRPWLVIPCCYVQPLFLELSLTTLTETALAFYLALAVELAGRGRWRASAAVLSIALVTRHEAIALVPVWVAIARSERVPLRRLWPVVWAPVLIAVLSWWFLMPVAARRWIEIRPTTWYGSGGWLTMLARAIQAWGPAIGALAFAGLRPIWRSGTGRLIAASVVVFFGVQTLVRALGLFESGGYARFLVPISPLIAIAAAAGWERLGSSDATQRRAAVEAAGVCFVLMWIAMEVQLRRPESAVRVPGMDAAAWAVRIATAVVLATAAVCLLRSLPGTAVFRGVLAVFCIAAPLATVRVLRLGSGERIVAAEMRWLAEQGLAARRMESAHPYCEYLAGLTPPPARAGLRGRIEAAPVGTIVVWDRQFAPGPGQDVPVASVDLSAAFRLLHAGEPLPGEQAPYVRIYEKVASSTGDVAP